MSKINNPAETRDRARKNRNRKRGRDENIKQNQMAVARKNRKTQLDELLAKGYTDLRRIGDECTACHKKRIKSETLTVDSVLNDDETPSSSSYNHQSKVIKWHSCLPCDKKQQQIRYINGTKAFDNHHIKTLQRHLSKSRDDIKLAINQFREQFDGKCAACGIQTIKKGKSGFRQESFTDMYPKKRTRDDPSCDVDDMILVCLACQYFQDNLSWGEFYGALCEVRCVEGKSKNLSPLTENETLYLISGSRSNGKTVSLRRKLFTRDGRHCQYTGIEMKFEAKHWNTVSFDRLDTQIERYNFENTHLVCKNINYIKKHSITEDELKDWIAHVRSPDFVFQHDTRQVQ
jgi:hypothetical protein